MDKEENHYMIIKDTRCIKTRFDDSKQQVCQDIHLWVNDMDFEEWFEKHNMDPDEKISFEEDWKKHWKPTIEDEDTEANDPQYFHFLVLDLISCKLCLITSFIFFIIFIFFIMRSYIIMR